MDTTAVAASRRNQLSTRAIAVVDMVWAGIELPLTCLVFFGGETFDGLFYQIHDAARRGFITADQALGKRALSGLLFFFTVLLNFLRMIAACVLYHGSGEGVPARKAQQHCRFWLYSSAVLLLVDTINLTLYITQSWLELVLAGIAFSARALFILGVRLFITVLRSEIRNTTTVIVLPAAEDGRPGRQLQRPVKLSSVKKGKRPPEGAAGAAAARRITRDSAISPVSREQLYSFAITEDGGVEQGSKSLRSSIVASFPNLPAVIETGSSLHSVVEHEPAKV